MSACLRYVTVEPALLLFILADDLQKTTASALWYDKCCLHLYGEQGLCDNVNKNESSQEVHVTQVRSDMHVENLRLVRRSALLLQLTS